jgi:hypothetical protein
MVLKWCYNGVAMVLQWYQYITEALERRHYREQIALPIPVRPGQREGHTHTLLTNTVTITTPIAITVTITTTIAITVTITISGGSEVG